MNNNDTFYAQSIAETTKFENTSIINEALKNFISDSELNILVNQDENFLKALNSLQLLELEMERFQSGEIPNAIYSYGVYNLTFLILGERFTFTTSDDFTKKSNEIDKWSEQTHIYNENVNEIELYFENSVSPYESLKNIGFSEEDAIAFFDLLEKFDIHTVLNHCFLRHLLVEASRFADTFFSTFKWEVFISNEMHITIKVSKPNTGLSTVFSYDETPIMRSYLKEHYKY